MLGRSVSPEVRPRHGGAGRITGVMQAAMLPVRGARVLSIGLLEDGSIREQRVVDGPSVTVGESERATFVVEGVPGLHKLFHRVGADYYVQIAVGMKARIALRDRTLEMEGSETPQRVRLEPASRGRIVCGTATFLFQIVDRARPRARPALPLAVKPGVIGAIDWPITVIVALSFLFHFGLVGAMYSDWADPLVDEHITTGGLIDMVKSLPPDRIEVPLEPLPDPIARQPEPSPLTQSDKDRSFSTSSVRASNPGSHPGEGAVSEEARLAALAREAAVMQLDLIGDRRRGTALDKVLTKTDVPSVDLERAAALAVGADHARGSNLRVASADAPVHPGAVGKGFGDIARTRATGDEKVGKETATRGPLVETPVDPRNAIVPIPNAERVIAGLRPAFRACYAKGLDADSGMAGQLTIVASVAPNGEVASAQVEANKGLSPLVTQCLVRRVRGAQFDKPGPNGSTIRIPITFVSQAR